MLIATSPSNAVEEAPLTELGVELAENGDLVRREGAKRRRNGLRSHNGDGGLWELIDEREVCAGGGDMEESGVAMSKGKLSLRRGETEENILSVGETIAFKFLSSLASLRL